MNDDKQIITNQNLSAKNVNFTALLYDKIH